jgi:thermitase
LKLLLIAILALPLAVIAAPDAPAIPTDDTKIRYVQGHILVQPRAGLTEKEFDKILKPQNAKRSGKLSNINVHIISVPVRAELAVVNALSKNKHISFAEVDALVQPTLTLNDPDISRAWQIAKINAPSAWDFSSGHGILVADCDTGVDSDHPDLIDNLEASLGWNTASDNNIWEDINGHGTATTGVMAAVGNNTRGAAGIAYKTKVIPVRVSDRSDGSATISALANCVTYAADKGAKGANLSYSGMCSSSTIFNAAAYMRDKTGGVVVASAGNTGKEIIAANNANITCVAATDSADRRASFSSYGNFVDVAAPGVSTYLTTNGGGYGTASGTSFSSPITMGVYALMMQANPSLTPSQLDEILFSTALDLGTKGWDKYFGHGRVDAAAAVNMARSYSAADSLAPIVSFKSPTAGSLVSGIMNVDIDASDNVGVKSVSLTVNGQTYEDTVFPYQFSIDLAGFTDGPLTLQANARDEAGNNGSANISVTVANDQNAPSVSFNNPLNGATVSGTVNISVSATDDIRLSHIELAIDGKVVQKTVSSNTSANLTYSWTPCPNRNKCNGTSTLRATAFDAANNTSSTSITVNKRK